MTTPLLPEDLHHVLSRTPRDVCKLLRKNPWLFLGGGFVRSVIANESVNDIDLFGPSKASLELIAKSFALERKARFHETDNAFTVLTPGRHPVQFIHRWVYSEAEQLLSDFDFTIAQAVIWWKPTVKDAGEWRSLVSDYYYPDLASRRLRYLAPSRAEDAGGSVLRMRKFLARGYHIESNSLAKVIARLARGVRQVRESIEEPELAQITTALLREVDPLTVIDGLDLVDETQPIEGIGATVPQDAMPPIVEPSDTDGGSED
jgi:hypothetical protein